MGLYRRGPKWYADIQRDGVRHRVSLGTGNKRLAEAKHALLLQQLEAGEAGSLVVARMNPMDLLEEYLADLERQKCTDEHVASVRMRLTELCQTAPRVKVMSPTWCRQRLAEVSTQRGLKPQTQNRYRMALKAFFGWLVQDGRWPSNPVDRVSPARVEEKVLQRRPLTVPDELRALVDSSPLYRASIYAVVATTGLRRREAKRLTLDDLLEVGGTRAVRIVATSQRKRRVENLVPLVPWAHSWLDRWLSERRCSGPRVWDGWAGRDKVGVPTNPTMWRDLRRAGIQPVTPVGRVDMHSLRTTLATHLAMTKTPEAVTGWILRHSDPRVTREHYVVAQLRDAQSALECAFGGL